MELHPLAHPVKMLIVGLYEWAELIDYLQVHELEPFEAFFEHPCNQVLCSHP